MPAPPWKQQAPCMPVLAFPRDCLRLLMPSACNNRERTPTVILTSFASLDSCCDSFHLMPKICHHLHPTTPSMGISWCWHPWLTALILFNIPSIWASIPRTRNLSEGVVFKLFPAPEAVEKKPYFNDKCVYPLLRNFKGENTHTEKTKQFSQSRISYLMTQWLSLAHASSQLILLH